MTPSQSLITTCENQTGNSSTVAAHAPSTIATGRPIRLPRKHRQTAPIPTSHTMYCGLMTRLVAVNIRTATNAASARVCDRGRPRRSRHSSSQPRADAVSVRAAALTTSTYGPRNSTEP